MFKKHYYYNIIIKTRPDGSDFRTEQGVLEVPRWWTPRQAHQACVNYIQQAYEVQYDFNFQEFRRIK